MKRIIYICICLTILASSSIAQNSGIAVDPSLSIYGARPLGMGKAFLALSDDFNGIFFNPAGINKVERLQISATSRRLFFDETAYSLAGFVLPTAGGTFGLSIVDAAVGGSYATVRDPVSGRITLSPSQEPISYDNNVVLITYSTKMRKDISLGTNIKLYNQSLSGNNIGYRGTGTNFDIGALWEPSFLPYLKTGLAMQNIFATSIKWTTSSEAEDKLPGYTKIGAMLNVLGSKEVSLYKHPHKLRVALDFDLPRDVLAQDNSLLWHLGAEWSPEIENLWLRGGLEKDLSGATNLSLGVGYIKEGFGFDYAYYARGNGLAADNPHYFSLTYVGKPPADLRKIVRTNLITNKTPSDRHITIDRGIPVAGTVGYRIDKYMPQSITIASPEVRTITNEATGNVTYEIVAKEFTKTELILITSETSTIEGLFKVTVNNIETQANAGTSSFKGFYPSLEAGRNVLRFTAYTTPETKPYAEQDYRVLLFTPFKDVTMEYWAIEPIALISTLKIIQGYPDNTFKPEKGITRGELVTLLVRTLRVPLESAETPVFKDVTKKHWAAAYIHTGAKLGLINGYPDNTFKPNKVLTRAEGVTVLARFADLAKQAQNSILPYPDLKANYWANVFIRDAKAAGMLKYIKTIFEPDRHFTRAEATEVLYRTPKVQRKVDAFWDKGIIDTDTPQKASVEAVKAESVVPLKTTEISTLEPSWIQQTGNLQTNKTIEAFLTKEAAPLTTKPSNTKEAEKNPIKP